MTEMYQHTNVIPRITVLFDSSNENVKKQFHCPVCGFVVFEYYDNIRVIVPGGQMRDEVGTARRVVTCHGKCKLFSIDENGDLVPIMKPNLQGNMTPASTACRTQFYI